MYIQITTKCNMSCAHCIFSCEQGKPGEFMTPDIFAKSVALSEDYGSNITIGGGEPTLHPKFWQYFGEAMAAEVEYVWMATNGSVKKIAKALAGIASGSEKFGVALSQDSYHDPIDWNVVRTFERLKLEIRNVEGNIAARGAALENDLGGEDRCGCGGGHIDPDGTVKMCGCPGSLELGHVNDLDDGVYQRAGEVGRDILGTECGYKLEQKYIDYILDNADLDDDDEEEAA